MLALQQLDRQTVTANTSHVAAALARLTHPSWRCLMEHLAHFIALGAGSGLSHGAPGTAGTLWAWVALVKLATVHDWLRLGVADRAAVRQATAVRALAGLLERLPPEG